MLMYLNCSRLVYLVCTILAVYILIDSLQRLMFGTW
jgi:hypothetical protein